MTMHGEWSGPLGVGDYDRVTPRQLLIAVGGFPVRDRTADVSAPPKRPSRAVIDLGLVGVGERAFERIDADRQSPRASASSQRAARAAAAPTPVR